MGPSKWILADTDGYCFIFRGDFITLYPMVLGFLVRGQPHQRDFKSSGFCHVGGVILYTLGYYGVGLSRDAEISSYIPICFLGTELQPCVGKSYWVK